MKNLVKLFSALFIFILIFSCASNSTSGNEVSAEKLKGLLDAKEFTFMAKKANPTGGEVTNILNSLPGASASRIYDLDFGYSLVFKKEELVATLPYFGRLYNPSYDTTKNGYRFTSKDFKITESAGKKGSMIYYITTNDQQNVKKIILEIFSNGKAYLSIDSNDRQPISYDGYITENSK